MEQNNSKDQKTIKIAVNLQGEAVPNGAIMECESFLTVPCYSMVVTPLKKPIPIPKSRKKKRK